MFNFNYDMIIEDDLHDLPSGKLNVVGWNIPIFNRKCIFNPGPPFSRQLCELIPECRWHPAILVFFFQVLHLGRGPTPLASHHPAACGIVSAGALAFAFFFDIAQDVSR